MSPDGQQIVTFNPGKCEFTLYDIENFSKSISTFQCEDIDYDKRCCYSLAISNCINDDNERLVALSCFDAREILYDQSENPNRDDDEELGENGNQSHTWIISTTYKSEIHTSLGIIGGVIRFLDSDVKISGSKLLIDKTVIIVVNASGIYKQTFNNDNIILKQTVRRFLNPSFAKIEQFQLPQQLSISLSRLDHGQNALNLLHTSIIRNHFMAHSFKNRQQIIEMYSLITGDLEMLFKRHESSVAPNIIRGSPVFAISQNEGILAFCRGTISITLYLLENGLEITTKQLEGRRGRIYKIVAIEFIDNDRKLLIALEEETENLSGEISIHQIFVVWDLYTTFKDSIRQINYSESQEPLKMDATHRLINSHGKMSVVTDSGNIISVLDHQDVALIRNPPSKEMTKIDIIEDDVFHAIYNLNGERFDTSELTKNQLIIHNVEPWHSKNQYFRLSIWLDSTKILEYIWASKNVGSTGLRVQELKVGEREFVLNLSIPSTKFSTTKSMTIHWPNNINVLEGACRSLYVLGEMKHIVAGHKNSNRIEYLIECTQRLVRKYITKYGIFRLTDIRYSIMKYLIKSHQERLIKQILNKKINGKNSNIHVPRLYKRVRVDNDDKSNINMSRSIEKLKKTLKTTETIKTSPELKLKSKSDLHNAILCTQRRVDSTAILKYLIDYYADNAKEYNNDDGFVQSLFKKPCFGVTEAYTPPLHINSLDQKEGNKVSMIHALILKPRLASKPKITLLESIRFFKRIKKIIPHHTLVEISTSYNDRKVYKVPLPDFTVYPKGLKDHNENYLWILFTLFRIFWWPRGNVIKDTSEKSPFLRVIHEEESNEIYRTPAIMAVSAFKWSAARRHFIRHILTYILYAITYTITVISYSFTGESTNLFKSDSAAVIKSISFFVYVYTGWYLIVTEIVQLKRAGWYKYISIYSFFDIASVLLPFAVNIVSILNIYEVINLKYSVYNTVLAFTALVMWLEVLLLLRYFEAPGRFIYIITSILNNIWPFFAFMLIAILAFGHAMFLLLNHADDESLQRSTYKVEDTSDPGLYSNIEITQVIDKSSYLDNYYSHILSSVAAVFFWTNGRWDQLGQWDNYSVIIISILGSIILVGAFETANEEGRAAVQKYRAELIAEYETLEKPFGSKKGNPRYIYYIPNPDLIDNWLEETKKDNEKQRSRLMGNYSYSKKYKHILNDDSLEIEPITTKYNKFDKIRLIDEEIFELKVTSKSNKKSQINSKSSSSFKNKSSNEPFTDDDQLSTLQDKFSHEFKARIDSLENNFRTLLTTLNSQNDQNS
ncbi:8760_t:CDS:2 [Diversispora eburnea]|uniref:8760_t:CDS:1 n=2 Tax=Diversisporales TaxID=214509 RepID=A0A9N8ZC00_9GLOM|nr:8760_t:CDS:2 [Diversispora eburnea]